VLSSTVSPHAINLGWLIRLRWGTIAGQSATIALCHFWVGIELWISALVAVVSVELAGNLALALWMRRPREVREGHVFATLAFDVCALTALLAASGGPHNPFSFLYLVHIALAAVVLRPRWSWPLVALAAAASALLFVVPIAPLGEDVGHMAFMDLHLQGMWIAFAIGASFIVYFVMRVRTALARREGELAAVRAEATRTERLSSLATLAAGAAHELATPLGTIATVARELERTLVAAGGPDAQVADAQLIRQEVDRCKRVLQQMSADAGHEAAGEIYGTTVGDLVSGALSALPPAGQTRVATRVPEAMLQAMLKVPRHLTIQALKNILDNALEAGGDASVELHVNPGPEGVAIVVTDRGQGMEPSVLARASEPFFTTKPPGRGLGLGLFVARDAVERSGGRFHIESRPGHGTAVRLHLRLSRPPEMARAS
jgi:two-component system sensor histidine kinase RegB